MRNFVLIGSSFIFIFLQMVALRKLSFGDISPDFPLLLCGLFALFRGPIQGSIIGFFVGLLQDLFNPAFLGLNALTKSLVGFALGQIGTKTVPENSLFLLCVFLFAALGHDFVYLLFYSGRDLGNLFAMFFSTAVPSALYTAIFGVVVHKIVILIGSRIVRVSGDAR